MDEADKILINILTSFGVEIPDENSSLEDFSVDTLISITSSCLEVIFESQGETISLPKKCPQNIAARYKVGQTLSDALKKLGYTQTIGYQTFLYPNVKDTRNIVSFLVEHLPRETSASLATSSDSQTSLKSSIQTAFSHSLSEPWVPHFCSVHDTKVGSGIRARSIMLNLRTKEASNKAGGWTVPFPTLTRQCVDLPEMIAALYTHNKLTKLSRKIDRERLVQSVRRKEMETSQEALFAVPIPRRRSKFMVQKQEAPQEKLETLEKTSEPEITEKENELREVEKELEELKCRYGESVAQFNMVMNEMGELERDTVKLHEEEVFMKQELQEKEKESQVKEKIGIILANGAETYDKLKQAIVKKTQSMQNIEHKWDAHRDELESKIEQQQKLNNSKFSRFNMLVEQHAAIQASMDECRLDYQTKGGLIAVNTEKVKKILAHGNGNNAIQTRKEFTKRIFELTENKKKQDIEIKKILSDIFGLQKDINSLRGKLERSFIETNDLIFQFAKHDELSKKMYKVLVGIHENCQSLIGVIEEKGKLLREIRDVEMNLDVENRGNIDKNLAQISEDYEQAKTKCDQLKQQIKAAR